MWPVVAVVAVFLAKRLGRSALSVMSVLVLTVLAVSFVYAWYMHGANQEEAYLMTRTRFWELAFGGVLALLGARLTLPEKLRLPAGWLGFALIVLCGFFLDGAELFPGPGLSGHCSDSPLSWRLPARQAATKIPPELRRAS